MNDKISPDVEDHTDEQEDFDPLAELARIVAGEVEDADKEHQSKDPLKPDEENLVSDDMEVELMRELQEAPPESVEAEPHSEEQHIEPENLSVEIDDINEIDASVDTKEEVTSDDNVENASEGDFQNDLIDALQSELDEPEDTAAAAVTNEAVLEEIEESVVTKPEVPEMSEMTAEVDVAEVAAEVAEATKAEEPVAVAQTAEAAEEISFEEEMARIVEDVPQSTQSITQTAGIDSEEDLGKAFLDELESRVGISSAPEEVQAKEPPVEEVRVEEPPVEEVQAQAIEPSVDKAVDFVIPQAPPFSAEPQINPVVPEEPQISAELQFDPVVPEEPEIIAEPQLEPIVHEAPQLADEPQASDELELDFEQAFSHELGLGTSLDDDMVEAPALDAALADEIKTTTDDEVNLDPGHSGQIPEVASSKSESQVSGMKYAVVAILLALFAGAGVAIYGFMSNGSSLMTSDIPVIEADKTAYKVKPKDPGGKVVNNQDNATYAEVEGVDNESGSQKNLVSNLEEPAVLDQTKPDKDPKDTDRLTNTQQTEKAGATQNAVVKPRVVQIQTVKPDGTIVAVSPVSSASNKVEEQLKLASNQAKALATEVKTVTTQVIAPLKPLDGAKTSNQVVSPTASPKEKALVEPKKVEVKPIKVAVPQKKPAKPAVSTQVANVVEPAAQPKPKPVVVAKPAPTSAASAWVVQVSSSPTQQEAQASYNRMARKYPVIQGRSTNIVSAQVNGRTYYRLRLNTNSKSDAANLCSQLKASGGDCFITR